MKGEVRSELEYVEHISEAPMRLIVVSLDSSCPHWHEEYEVVFVLRGGLFAFLQEENRTCELTEGDVLLINSREVHSFRKARENNVCLILQFSPTIISEVYDSAFSFDLTPWGALDESTPGAFRMQLAEMGLLLHRRPDGYQFAVKSRLYAFVSLMFEKLRYSTSATDSKNQGFLADFDLIKQYIKEHFREELDQAIIGKELGMSRSKMYRVLRFAGDSGTTDLINYFRVEHAKHLLLNSKQSVAAIASDSGFPSDVSFHRVFKEATGASPSEYRKTPRDLTASVGIQGYAFVDAPDSLGLLKHYAGQAKKFDT